MNVTESTAPHRFYRDADRAMLGGVCAGLARYLGFNLCATRFLAVLTLFMTGPLFVVAYIAAVLLIPSQPGRERSRRSKARSRRCRRSRAEGSERRSEERHSRAQIINEKCADLDARLQVLEKHVTSRKFQIEQELSRL